MNITHGLRRALSINAGGTATIFGDRIRTWSQAGGRIAKLASGLRKLGVAEGDRVAVLMVNSDRYLDLYLAVAWAGAVIVPLNIRWNTVENEYALRDCGARVLFVDRAYCAEGERLKRSAGAELSLVYADDGDRPDGVDTDEALIARSAPMDDAMRRGDDLAGIFYTGGTTGRSKGVMLSHGSLMANACNALAEGLFGSDAVFMHAAPMFHLANGAAMYSLMLSGGINVILRSFEPAAALELIERRRVTDTLLVPTLLQALVDHPSISSRDLRSLRRIVYGASPMTQALMDRALAACPNAGFVQAYGMTELSPIATILHAEHHVGEARAAGRSRSVGRPTFGVELRVVDDRDRPVPVGTVGEIVVRGDTVMMGYWNRPEETAEAKRGGWMHTGDGGYMDEHGFVYLADRIKDMIISGGENVYSVEVENVVARHPAVAQCAVIGVPHDRWGEQVHAVIVLHPGKSLDADELISFCKARIGGFKVPRSMELRETLPLSGAGKVLKHVLRAEHREAK